MLISVFVDNNVVLHVFHNKGLQFYILPQIKVLPQRQKARRWVGRHHGDESSHSQLSVLVLIEEDRVQNLQDLKE